MNILGKIFVFAVFVMSLVFMSFAIALYSTHTNWKEEILRESNEVRVGKPLGWKAQLTEAKKEREKAQGEIDTLKSEVAASVSNCASSGSTFPQEPFHVVFMVVMVVMAVMAPESTPAASLKPALFGTLE